jgi:carboxypeptidase family protein
MSRNWRRMVALALILMPSVAFAQQTCTSGIQVEGVITDPTGAVIPGATLQASTGETTTTDAEGRYVLPCVRDASVTLTVTAQGFAPGAIAIPDQPGTAIKKARLDLRLDVANVQTSIRVSAEPGVADSGSEGTTVLGTQEVQQLADDPDDLLRQLQVMASADGGDPAAAVITVDGFQNGGVLPPKSSIASIRVNPDLFSSEFSFPPFGGGMIQIFTKPGADSPHGAVFYTDSEGSFNATDPFSLTATPASKRRFGFELSGPIAHQKSGFSLALEKRNIDEFDVVNAVTLDADNNPTPLQESVAAPQRLWIGSARGDWQVTPTDTATVSYSAKVNSSANQGAGGLVLPQAGYGSVVNEYDLRLVNRETLSANLLHETFLGYSWKRTLHSPVSAAPSVQVAGYFTGGGATSQSLNDRERDLEIDDDLLATHGKHSLKFGAQSLGIFVHDYDPDTFNGAYVFGGGSAPLLDGNNNPTGQTTAITSIEQYRRALLNLAGGAPTTYQLTSGNPLVPLTQWRLALYAQDDIKLAHRFAASTGLRYQFQTTPNSFAMFDPRLGFVWTPDKRERWVFHVRAGLFHHTTTGPDYATEAYRLNGLRQKQTTVYSPSYSDPLKPVSGSIQVATVDQFPHSLTQTSTFVTYVNAEHDFSHQWHVRANFFWGDDWDAVRVRNINAPLVAGSIGTAPDPTAALLAPRPIPPGENIMEYQNSAHLAGNVFSISVDQHSYKRFGLNARYAHLNFKNNSSDGVNPQSSYSDQGESARVDWLRKNEFSLRGNVILPYKIELSTEFDASQGVPYNITTGTDDNGDGDFSDRPSYATGSASDLVAGVYSTRFGLLTANTVNGDIPRDLGTMPGLIHLDSDLSRAFILNSSDKDHPLTLTFNTRSANLLNHTNVNAVETVLSPTLGKPISAETGRRIEVGVRFAF